MTDDRRMNAPEFLADLFQYASDVSRQIGLNDDDADRLADRLVDRVADEWGGLPIYIGKGTYMKLSRRDLDIYREFNGHNHQELAHKYGITKVRVYAIIRRVKRELEEKNSSNQRPLL